MSDLGTPNRRDLPDRMRSVVYLETAPRGAFEQTNTGRVVMDQHNETFVPHVLAITTGTIVDFPNSDHIYHNVFSLSKTAQFDLGRYATDQRGAAVPGAAIELLNTATNETRTQTTNDSGYYTFVSVPPGNYNMIAWNEGTLSDPIPVLVPGGGVAELDITLR